MNFFPRSIIKTAEFWIVVLFLVRLVGITAPPLEGSHNWRQCTDLMVARNLYEGNGDLLHPMVEDTGATEGVIGMEFPLLSGLHALTAQVFGYTHWYGRLINLLVSSLGLWFFAKILRLFKLDERVVLTSTLFLGVSIWFCFSRKIMADTFCISLIFIALYCGIKYLEGKSPRWLFAYALTASVAVLSKIPAALYLVLLLPAVMNSAWSRRNRVWTAIATLLPVTVAVLWYFVWNPHLATMYGNWYNQGLSVREGLLDCLRHPMQILDNFYFDAFCGFLLFIASCIGFILLIIKKKRKEILIFLLLLMAFIAFIIKSGYHFYDQSYYMIPFVPAMALLAGYAISSVSKNWIFITLMLVCCAESIGNQQHDFFIKEKEKYKMEIAEVMKAHADDGLVMVNGKGNPQLLYLAHRKGWSCTKEDIENKEFMTKKIAEGCRYLVIDLHAWPDFSMEGSEVWRDENFAIIVLPANI